MYNHAQTHIPAVHIHASEVIQYSDNDIVNRVNVVWLGKQANLPIF